MPYPKRDGDEYYEEDDKGDQIYIRDEFMNQKYAVKYGYKPFYAELKGGIQYYAKTRANHQYYALRVGYIERDGDQIYAVDNKNNQLYYSIRGKQTPAIQGGKQVYAQWENGTPYYPKNDRGDEYFIKEGEINLWITDSTGEIVYRRDHNCEPMYPVDSSTKREIYKRNIAQDRHNNYRYAKDENGDEYYMQGNGFKEFGTFVYAKKKDRTIVYPLVGSDEYYETKILFGEEMDDLYPLFFKKMILRYAHLKDKTELYPTRSIGTYTYQVPIPGLGLARFSDGTQFYPLDPFGNEYVPTGEEVWRYPVTNDNLIIVPNVNGKPAFIEGDDSVTYGDIQGLLFRGPLSSDFLTNVKSKTDHQLQPAKYFHHKLAITVVQSYTQMSYIVGLVAILFVILAILLKRSTA